MKRVFALGGVLAAMLMLVPAAQADDAWDAPVEFRTFPNQANPNPDHHGRIGWKFMEGPTSGAHNPATYSLFTVFALEQSGCAHVWTSTNRSPAGAPSIYRVHQCAVPVHNFIVQPEASRSAIVAWQSPITGTVSVTGGVLDTEGGGNGIEWWIDKGGTTLASGAMDDGGAQDFSAGSGGSSLSGIPVVAGDHLYFIVGPKAGDAAGDATGMNLRIAGVPTSVRLRSLTVMRGPHGVDVRWRTAAEAGVLGFNLFREIRDRPAKVNRALIAARGTAAGSVYHVVDRPGAGVYRLQAIRVDGTRSWIGIARS